MAKTNEGDPNAVTTIASGTTIIGDMNSNGDVRFNGALEGNLIAKGKLVIGPTGKITGDVKCKNSDVSGEVEGKINVSELLSLRATSKINGDIITSKLSIEPGAKFTGTCNMNGGQGIQSAYGRKTTEKNEGREQKRSS